MKIKDVEKFKASVDIISNLIQEAQLKLDSKGLHLISMDTANVAMVVWEVEKSDFESYSIKDDLLVGINFETLKGVLKRVGKDDVLTIDFGDKITIKIDGKSKKVFEIPAIDITNSKEQKIPELKFEVEGELKIDDLKQILDDVSIVGESVEFNSDKVFNVSARGDLTNVEIKIDTAFKGKGKSRYSLEYLNKMVSTKLGDNCKIGYSTDYPLRLSYDEIYFILAPRVDND